GSRTTLREPSAHAGKERWCRIRELAWRRFAMNSTARTRLITTTRLVTLSVLALSACGGGEKSDAEKAYDDCVANAGGDPMAEMECLRVKTEAEKGSSDDLVGVGDEESGPGLA